MLDKIVNLTPIILSREKKQHTKNSDRQIQVRKTTDSYQGVLISFHSF